MSNYFEKFEKMRVAGKLASNTLDMITDYVKPGVSTDKLDQLCYEYIKDHGGYSAPQYYRGFKKSLCTSLNHVVCHGIPSDRILNDGDILNIDITAIVNNHYGDTSRMFSIGDIPIKAKNLIDENYYNNYQTAKKAGVKFIAYNCFVNSKEIKIKKKIKILDE